MQAIKMLKPKSDVIDEFETLVSDVSNQIHNLSSQNRKLREARDGLLPRLVSDEVDVSELDVR
jgi:type I restriction enzyme, S subunit